MADAETAEDSRAYIRRLLERELPEIMTGFLGEAKKGSVAHMKLTVELLSATKTNPIEAPEQKGILQRLLEEIDRD